jgi:deoxyribonuclease V
MITAVDCHYAHNRVVAAACATSAWDMGTILHKKRIHLPMAEDYVPGAFYKREMPAIIRLLAVCDWHPTHLIVDCYVDLNHDRPGMGRHLYNFTNASFPVIGVAKSPFAGSKTHVEVRRGKATRPLYVTSAGMPLATAAAYIANMHGDFRLPTLVKAADRAARELF